MNESLKQYEILVKDFGNELKSVLLGKWSYLPNKTHFENIQKSQVKTSSGENYSYNLVLRFLFLDNYTLTYKKGRKSFRALVKNSLSKVIKKHKIHDIIEVNEKSEVIRNDGFEIIEGISGVIKYELKDLNLEFSTVGFYQQKDRLEVSINLKINVL